MTFYLICYDIVEDRRRTKVSSLLEAYGIRVQKSVFEAVLTPPQFKKLEQRLKKLINSDCDQLRFYPLLAKCRTQVIILGIQPNFAVDDAAIFNVVIRLPSQSKI
ncbi:MAG: CRISPR-associated endonuclease Cas2 [Limnospira sp. PMC 1291.21]|uniref:CRISPR-associated endoribonuclease Cas2 n=1 Tax=Limnospira maxima CS-328 TaxID=513049 RepID=B5W4Q0_LIMMA|nr:MULTISPECIES: CRISPR-associated endonuclease Cas2 [Limnospira]MBD2671092.1 CRISPR-associated endonuclease Cas2 [Arthrospira platensis FACHB-439]MDC0836693.1 CRISPR-associated endonuclease Cas2 [Limnoraphis robusta]UWU49672.1 CRISPR-associated protein Cas2 [Arthrospira platensis C1]EDZ93492.1 CRISPR-associated protein Cas2 [Limnospira maxima CS-328]MDT9177081.1 CRISPR-associated endonuclease Cas2 [Limnospira sp. PMC 1238.20]